MPTAAQRSAIVVGLLAVTVTLACAAPEALSATSGVTVRHSTPQHIDRGEWLVYQSSTGLRLVRPDGSGGRPYFTGPTRTGNHPDWSPRRNLMLFVRDEPDGTTDVYAANLDGRAERRLIDTAAPHTYSEDPAWSPDGKRLAVWTEGDSDVTQVIKVLDAASGKVETIVRAADYLAPVNPRWSPDGRYLAVGVERYVADGGDVRREGGAIGLIDLRAPDPSIQLPTTYSIKASYPAWSPTGDRIMFTGGNLEPYSSPSDGPNNLFTIRPDGTDLVQLTDFTQQDPVVAGPDWGSGDRPVVVSLVYGADSYHLATLDANGTDLREVIDRTTGLPVDGAHPRHVARAR